MAYRFVGFFARPVLPRPETLPYSGVWREITEPFVGVGVRLAGLCDGEPGPEDASRLLCEVGLSGATDWIFLDYSTWGGPIEYVYGLGESNGWKFGPVTDSDVANTETSYVALMSQFGVAAADALNFPPFVRGFWGKA